MVRIYSTYEAKARFSEILRQVREGKTVTISYHGEPVAEIRPLRGGASLDQRLDRLAARGVLVRASERESDLKMVVRRRGALKRFLAERKE